MKKHIERSLSQVLYKYLPQTYADFDIEGNPITARIIGWNASIQPNQNKKRIMYELYNHLNRFPNTKEQKDLNDLLDALDKNQTEAFDIRALRGQKDENDHRAEIVSVLRPHVFYCNQCGVVHIITNYPNTDFKNYKYFINDLYDEQRHRCLDCGGKLRQQQIIRVSADGNAYDYEPMCEIHRDQTKYKIKIGEPRSYYCSECDKVIKRQFRSNEDLAPALDPKVFFPHIISIVDLKNDDEVELISQIPYLAKLLVLSELGVISTESYIDYHRQLVELTQLSLDYKSPEYIMKTKEIRKITNMLNEPKFETFNNEGNYYYRDIALRLLELKEIRNKTTVEFTDIISENIKDNRFVSSSELEYLLNKSLIDKVTISENVPVNNIAYGYTRLLSEVRDKENYDKLRLRLYKDHNTNKFNLYSYKLESEGVLIQFDRKLMLEWIKQNLKEVINNNLVDLYVLTNDDYRIDYFNNGIRSIELNTVYNEVLHTASHVFMNSISNASGIEVTSLAEMIFPEVGAIFIYCTSVEGMVLNSIKTAITKRLYYVIKRALDSVMKCNLKNLCDSKNKQACLGCVLIPEISCKEFNSYLDRKLLSNIRPREYQICKSSQIQIDKGMWIEWRR